MLQTTWQITEKDLGVLMDTKLNTSQKCALVKQKVNIILSCIRNVTSRLRQILLSLYPALVRSHRDFCFHQRAIKMIKGL